MDAFDLLRLIEDLPDIRKHFPACLALPNPYIFFKLYNDQVLHFAYPPYLTIADMFYPITALPLLQPKYSCKIISTLSALKGYCFVSYVRMRFTDGMIPC